jgi:hypothetical protein
MSNKGQMIFLAIPGGKFFGGPSDYIGGENLGPDRDQAKSWEKSTPGAAYVEYFSLSVMLNEIRVRLAAETWMVGTKVVKGACLRQLEICAHGRPGRSNGITEENVDYFADYLKHLNLCDELDIYLSGCNTGVYNSSGATGDSIAQLLSAAGPTISENNVQCTVWGAVGYMSGMHATGNEKCFETAHVVDAQGVSHDYTGYAPSRNGRHPGSQSGSGSSCWRGFREGIPL